MGSASMVSVDGLDRGSDEQIGGRGTKKGRLSSTREEYCFICTRVVLTLSSGWIFALTRLSLMTKLMGWKTWREGKKKISFAQEE